MIDSLNSIKNEIDIEDIRVYPEIGGKVAQLGTLDEIIRICKEVDFAYPCIDLAHLHARELGSMTTSEKIYNVFEIIEKELGRSHLELTHFHVYPVDYSDKGEKIHKAFHDKKEGQISLFETSEGYFPRAEHYIAAIKKANLKPVTICEAHNTQEIGAMLMRDIYFKEQ